MGCESENSSGSATPREAHEPATTPPGATAEATPADAAQATDATAAAASGSPDAPRKSAKNGSSDEAVHEAIENQALLEVLAGGNGKGSPFRKPPETDQGAEISKSISDVKRGKPATVGNSPGTAVHSRVKFRVDNIDETTLDPDSVVRRIRSRYLAGLKRCHQRLLKTTPTAGGRVNLRFTVSQAGRATKAEAKGFDGDLDECVRNLAHRWRFAAPKDDAGNPTTARFAVPILFKPRS